MSMSDHADEAPGEVDVSRRKFLVAATAITGGVGVVLAATPFVASWKPSERARAMGAPYELDVSKLEAGQMTTVTWRKMPIYVVRRTPEMVANLGNHDAVLKDPASAESSQPEYAKNVPRALKPEILVIIATCTHLGCLPKQHFEPGDAAMGADWPGGFFCPCHGSKFDLSGRVMAGSPASLNLAIPPYSFPDDNTVLIGVDAGTAAKGAA
jgi:ubiquinol-cytochrome c reductase iron-sulfur subunit